MVKEFSQDGRIQCSLLPGVRATVLIFMEKVLPAGSGDKSSLMSVYRRQKSSPSMSVCLTEGAMLIPKTRGKRGHSLGKRSQ